MDGLKKLVIDLSVGRLLWNTSVLQNHAAELIACLKDMI